MRSASYIVFSSDSPLVGQYSLASVDGLGPTYSPGPLLYWLLAVPARFVGSLGLPTVIGLVNVACVVGTLVLARRLAGFAYMFVAAAAIALMIGSFPAGTLHQPWNPSAALLPFLLLVFLSWSLARGDIRLLPIAVVVASFVAQCHLTYALPALALLLIGVGGLAVVRSRADSARATRWVVATAAVLLVCWSAPLIDQAVNDPGNLGTLVRTAGADRATLGIGEGLNATVRAVGVPPWWLRSPEPGSGWVRDIANRPSALSILSAAVVLGGLLGTLLFAWRHRRGDLVASTGLALALCVTLTVVTASVPRDRRS